MIQFIKFILAMLLLPIVISCNNNFMVNNINNKIKIGSDTEQVGLFYYNKKYSKLPIVLVRDSSNGNNRFFNIVDERYYPFVLVDTLLVNQCEEFFQKYFKGSEKRKVKNKVRIYAACKENLTDTIICIQLVTKKTFYKKFEIYSKEQNRLASPFLKRIYLCLRNGHLIMVNHNLPNKNDGFQ